MSLSLIITAVIGIVGFLFVQGWRKVPSDPPHMGQKTKWGRRLPGEFIGEGWHWFFLYPWFHGFIPVSMERVVLKVVSEKTRTPDRSESKVPIGITFHADPANLVNFLNNGGIAGVKNQLTGMVIERIREWAGGDEEGPANWEELNKSQLEAASVLMRQIVGLHLTKIPDYAQDIPTWIWLRYFAKPRPTKVLTNETRWAADNWKAVSDMVEKIQREQPPGSVDALREAVEKRRQEIAGLQTGTGKIQLTELGVILERLNLEDIDVLGEVAKHAEDEAKEEQDRIAETKELDHLSDRIKALMVPLPTGPGLTREQAIELVQLASENATKTIDAKVVTLDAGTAEMIASILGRKP